MLTNVAAILATLCIARAVEVNIEQGRLLGKASLDVKNGTFYSFLSIPYAKPPLGNLRFKAPIEADGWEGVLNATTDMPYCAQLRVRKVTGTEDCLYLNVHTPSIPNKDDASKKLLPVLFFIHGGGFIESSGAAKSRGADYLMPANVLLVTVNYRLGLFGFISSKNPELDIPGNAGLKDQSMALRWVNKNIHKFGGDPNNVMVFGESAGGVSAHLHMLSPLSKGLFHKVIAMSGNVGTQWSEGVLGTLEIKAKELGIYSDDGANMLRAFQEIPMENILSVQRKGGFMIPICEPFESSPVVELQSSGAFLPHDPLEMISSGNYTKVPFIFGYTNVDGLVYEVVERLYNGKPFIPSNFSQFVPSNFKLNEQQLEEYEFLLKQFYYGEEEPSENNLMNTASLVTDVWFANGDVRLINAMDNFDDVYFYKFSADTALNFMKKRTKETANRAGACHGDDLGYLLKSVGSPNIIPGSQEEVAMENTVRLFTNFAKTGRPTLPNDTVQWLPMSAEVFNYMDINTVLTPGVDPDQEHFAFWRNLYKKFNVTT